MQRSIKYIAVPTVHTSLTVPHIPQLPVTTDAPTEGPVCAPVGTSGAPPLPRRYCRLVPLLLLGARALLRLKCSGPNLMLKFAQESAGHPVYMHERTNIFHVRVTNSFMFLAMLLLSCVNSLKIRKKISTGV